MNVEILKPEDCYDQMLYEYQHGKIKGTTTYNSRIDNAWTWRLQEFNIWTGYANEGKSLMIKQMSLIKALKEKKKFIFCSPEDYPASNFFDDMIHTLSGMSTDKDRNNYISQGMYEHCYNLIKDLFYFLYIKPPDNTIEQVLSQFQKLIDKEEIFGCIIDPILKFTRSPKAPDKDDQYAAYIGTMMVDFARRNNISLHLVMHQLTPKMTESGLYPKPNMYTVKGGGSWNDGVDNLLYVQRPFYAKDKINDEVLFGSQKIKHQKLVGIPQDIKLKFNRKTNRYMMEDMDDMFYFDSFLI
jgi:twinkle protein